MYPHRFGAIRPLVQTLARRSIHNGMGKNKDQRHVSLTFIIPSRSGLATHRKVHAMVGSSLLDLASQHEVDIHKDQATLQIGAQHDGMHVVARVPSPMDQSPFPEPMAQVPSPIGHGRNSEDPRLKMLHQIASEQQQSIMKLQAELQEMSKQLSGSSKRDNTSDKKGSGEDFEKLKEDMARTKMTIGEGKRAIRFEDVVGLEASKRALRESVLWPAMAQSGLFTGIRSAAKGLLLYGPPGCGKTMLARAAAHELRDIGSFFYVRPGDLMNKYYGETQRRIQALQEVVSEARPAVVFLDEVDSLLGHRTGSEAAHHLATTNSLLEWMDGFAGDSEGVFFLAATNRPEAIDEAALRRFGNFAEVGSPTLEARLALIQHLVGKARIMNHSDSLTSCDLRVLSEKTAGRSLADVEGLVRRSYLQVLRELDPADVLQSLPAQVPPVTMDHFEKALLDSKGASAAHKFFQERKSRSQVN